MEFIKAIDNNNKNFYIPISELEKKCSTDINIKVFSYYYQKGNKLVKRREKIHIDYIEEITNYKVKI